MTTARKLYEFLEMNPAHYARWCKTNITDNPFAEERVDFEVLTIDGENSKRGRPTQDFKLTANFAKKLSMQGKTERAEQAREYFIRVEDKLKEVVVNKDSADSILKNKKQHETNRGKHYTSPTPIPKIKDSLGIAKVRESNEKLKNGKTKQKNLMI